MIIWKACAPASQKDIMGFNKFQKSWSIFSNFQLFLCYYWLLWNNIPENWYITIIKKAYDCTKVVFLHVERMEYFHPQIKTYEKKSYYNISCILMLQMFLKPHLINHPNLVKSGKFPPINYNILETIKKNSYMDDFFISVTIDLWLKSHK